MAVIDIKWREFFYAEIVKQYVDFTAGGVPQPEGIGFAKSIYWEGYGINYYDEYTVTIWGLYDSGRNIILGCVLGRR